MRSGCLGSDIRATLLCLEGQTSLFPTYALPYSYRAASGIAMVAGPASPRPIDLIGRRNS